MPCCNFPKGARKIAFFGVVLLSFLFTGCLSTTAKVPIPSPRVVVQDQGVEQYEPPIGEVASVYFLDNSVEINGDFSKWDGLISAEPRVMVYGGQYKPANTSGKFVLSTDGSNLYIFANVVDDVPHENQFSPSLAWRSDSVEIFVGIDTSSHKKFAIGDNQIRLVPKSKVDNRAYGVAVNDVDKTEYADVWVEYKEDGYLIEAKLPLDLLNIKSLSLGQKLRAEFQINDADRGERERMVHWMSPKDDVYYDPSSWGDALVVIGKGE
jgi:hypothetical protein